VGRERAAACHSAGTPIAYSRVADLRCKDADEFQEKVSRGDGRMPAFAEIPTAAVARIADFVAGLCVP
jgi:hypothetical protein